MKLRRHNPADEPAANAVRADVAWGTLYAQEKNGEIDRAEFRRQRWKVFLLTMVPALIATVTVIVEIARANF